MYKMKTIKKSPLLLGSIIFFMLITGGILVSALQCDGTMLGTFKVNNNIELRQTCDTCSYVTLSSITYPNSTILNVNTNMTKSGIDYNYSFKTDLIGNYYYSVFGDKDGSLASENFCFEVTPTGFIGTIGFYIIILILSLGILILGYYIEDAWVVVLGSFGFILFGLFIFLYGIDGMKDSAYTYGIAIITMMLGAYFGIKGALEQIGYN